MKAVGLTAMILAIISIFIPIFGVYFTVISALLLVFGFGQGLVFGIVAMLINIMNLLIFSPSVWLLSQTTGLVYYLVAIQILSFVILIVLHLFWRLRKINKVNHETI